MNLFTLNFIHVNRSPPKSYWLSNKKIKSEFTPLTNLTGAIHFRKSLA